MRLVFLTFIASFIYIIVRIVLAPTVEPLSEITVRVKSDYVFMLALCTIGLLAMMLPGYLRRRVRLDIPNVMMIAYALFLYCAIYLGEIRNFYYTVAHWDTVLHMFSGVALGTLGFSIVSLLSKSEYITFSLGPAFVAIFAFCFALALGSIWEISEFTVDSLLHTNSQKYALETGEDLVGQAALVDTMKDLIVDAIGALAVSTVGYISLKHRKGWLEKFYIRRLEENSEERVD